MGLTVSAPKIGTLATGWNSRWGSRWWGGGIHQDTPQFILPLPFFGVLLWIILYPAEMWHRVRDRGGVNLSRLSLNPNGAPPTQGGKKHPCDGVSPTHPWDRGIWGGGCLGDKRNFGRMLLDPSPSHILLTHHPPAMLRASHVLFYSNYRNFGARSIKPRWNSYRFLFI